MDVGSYCPRGGVFVLEHWLLGEGISLVYLLPRLQEVLKGNNIDIHGLTVRTCLDQAWTTANMYRTAI